MSVDPRQIRPIPLLPVLVGILALPIVEFIAFFWVADRIGLLPALVLLIATSVLGAALLRVQGASVVARLTGAMRTGLPADRLAREGLALALGGFLMIIPGFVTDAIGFAILLPGLLRSLREGSAIVPSRGGPARPRHSDDRILDLSAAEWRSVEDERREP